MLDFVSLAVDGVTLLGPLLNVITVVPPPACPPCPGGDPVLCALRWGVTMVRAVFWGQPC